MNPIVILLADGNAFFIGSFLAVLGVVGRSWKVGWLGRSVLRVTSAIGVVFIAASGTPFSIWVYCVWGGLWLAVSFMPIARTRRFAAPCFLLISISLCLLEVPWHMSPHIPHTPGQQVYVIGDSISAGIDPSELTWPSVLGDIAHLNVTNLARPGATASTALSQVDGITAPNSLVIIEIGGNDMLGGTDTDQFFEDLKTLLSRIPPSCHCVMFELPVLPFKNGYDRAQRNLATRYKVILIPKQCLADAIGGKGNTLDGLHLSQKGHNALAESVLRLLVM